MPEPNSAKEYLRSIDSPLTVKSTAAIAGVCRETLSRMWNGDRERFKKVVAQVHNKLK